MADIGKPVRKIRVVPERVAPKPKPQKPPAQLPQRRKPVQPAQRMTRSKASGGITTVK